MNLIREIIVKNYPEDNTPIINVLDNETSFLLIDEWPMEDDDRFSESEIENFEKILSDLSGVEVIQEDRDRFLIMSNSDLVVEKIVRYLEDK